MSYIPTYVEIFARQAIDNTTDGSLPAADSDDSTACAGGNDFDGRLGLRIGALFIILATSAFGQSICLLASQVVDGTALTLFGQQELSFLLSRDEYVFLGCPKSPIRSSSFLDQGSLSPQPISMSVIFSSVFSRNRPTQFHPPLYSSSTLRTPRSAANASRADGATMPTRPCLPWCPCTPCS
jgi:hypothetical protein